MTYSRPTDLADWPLDRRERWGELANYLESQGVPFPQSEITAYEQLTINPDWRPEPCHDTPTGPSMSSPVPQNPPPSIETPPQATAIPLPHKPRPPRNRNRKPNP